MEPVEHSVMLNDILELSVNVQDFSCVGPALCKIQKTNAVTLIFQCRNQPVYKAILVVQPVAVGKRIAEH